MLHVWHGMQQCVVIVSGNAISEWSGRLRIMCEQMLDNLSYCCDNGNPSIHFHSAIWMKLSFFYKYDARFNNIIAVWWEMIHRFCFNFPRVFTFQRWNNFENRLRFDEVTAIRLVASLFGTRCILTCLDYSCLSQANSFIYEFPTTDCDSSDSWCVDTVLLFAMFWCLL